MISLLLAAPFLRAQDSAAGTKVPALANAYAALQARSYEAAIELFQQAISAEPNNTAIRKDLAYTYLKVGEPESARRQFGEAMRIDPADTHVALEYAFLCNETRQQAEARRIFDRIRKTGNTTAETAFQNIDGALKDGIARWTKALELSSGNFSAHYELARLAEQRDELPLAAEHYQKAFALRPDMRALLLDLARVWKLQSHTEDATAALLAASRGGEPRVAETAREQLPPRYPYVYEFKKALLIDPKNIELRRELGYLHLAMNNKVEAIVEFQNVTAVAPDDLLSAAQLGFLLLSTSDRKSAIPLLEKALGSKDKEITDRVRKALSVPTASAADPGAEPAALATRSMQAGYLKDALKYLRIAHENDPTDYSVLLKLGWTYNILHDDKTAMGFFKRARESPDRKIAEEAARAFENLRPSQARVRTTVWTFPFYSSRWKDVFSYSQIKTEFKLGSLPIHPYISTRIIGDVRGHTDSQRGLAAPQYLSESSFIFAAGISTTPWKGLMGWGEAGEAVRYREQPNVGRMIPDYRGGLSFSRSVGHNLGAESKGLFFESNNDGVFVSRFQNDVLLYSQNHLGYTLPEIATIQFQMFWNGNVTRDWNRQYWANYYEQGPGVKFRTRQMPRALAFQVSAVKGYYTIRDGNPHGAHFYDLRAGFWYAFTR
ncbi:MAG: tetratricopeptide repeat protein [Bryobacteraceae bacterium]